MSVILLFIVLFGISYFLLNVVPKIPTWLKIRKASELILNKEYEKGLEVFEKAAKSKRMKPFTKIRYAFVELKYGDIAKAKKQISLILNDRTLKPRERYEAKSVWALIVLTEGDIEQTEELCEELYKNYLNTDVYCTLGYIYNKLRSPGEAVRFNLEAYDYNSDKAVIADNLGQAYYLNGQADEAEKIYKAKEGENPEFPEFWYNYALVEKALGDNGSALRLAKTALEKEFHHLTTVTREEVSALIKELEGNDTDAG